VVAGGGGQNVVILHGCDDELCQQLLQERVSPAAVRRLWRREGTGERAQQPLEVRLKQPVAGVVFAGVEYQSSEPAASQYLVVAADE
jgi:hypothetical protein